MSPAEWAVGLFFGAVVVACVVGMVRCAFLIAYAAWDDRRARHAIRCPWCDCSLVRVCKPHRKINRAHKRSQVAARIRRAIR